MCSSILALCLLPASSFLGFGEDECTGALPLADGNSGTYSNQLATTSSPGFDAGAASGADIWFRYTASANGQVRFSTASANTTFDTTMAAFSGSCGSLTLLTTSTGDPAAANPLHATLVLSVTAGTEYLLLVGGASDGAGDFARGTFDLSVSPIAPPANDTLANAELISADHLGTGSTLGASTSPEAMSCLDPQDAGGDVWYEIVAPDAGCNLFGARCAVSVENTDFPAVLTLYEATGSFTLSLSELDCVSAAPGGDAFIPFSADPTFRFFARISGMTPHSAGTYTIQTSVDFGDASTFGPNCSAATFEVADAPTRIGELGSITMTGAVGMQQILWIGFSVTNVPLCSGCVLQTEMAATFSGSSIDLEIPCLEQLIGESFFCQGMDVIGVGGAGCAIGTIDFTVTDTLSIVIGS